MAETVELPAPLERTESVPMEIMNKCAYGEPSTKTIMIMGAVAAVLASITVYCIVSWARRSARAKFKAMIKSVFEEVDHDHGGTVDSDELYTAVLLVYLQVKACVEIKILRRVRAESSRRPPRHRRDACSMAWRCRFLAARPSQDGRVIAEK